MRLLWSRTSSSGPQLTDENKVTAPDQTARRVYGNGKSSASAAGIRATCPEKHGPVAVYLDDTALVTPSARSVQRAAP